MSDYLLDNFASVKPGEPYRLLPFGVVVKGGVRREITPDIARRFRLPHFKPPIKLGSHDPTTPAGGYIIGLEVRDDGLYAIPEHTDKGADVLRDGSYRYHSPEVIWEGGGLENPADGETIPGPLIVGDALLHTPHLGEAAALFTFEEVTQQMTDNVSVPATLWDKFVSWFGKRVDEQTTETPAPQEEEPAVDYSAVIAERDAYRAQIETIQFEAAKRQRVDNYAAQLVGKPVDQNGAMLASMTDEQAAWVIAQFTALSEQIKANDVITREIGHESEAEPLTLERAIALKRASANLDYVQAFEAVRVEHPELFR